MLGHGHHKGTAAAVFRRNRTSNKIVTIAPIIESAIEDERIIG
jgi:hypothetical protein